jgi:2-methylcitrate dehydratase PrpD
VLPATTEALVHRLTEQSKDISAAATAAAVTLTLDFLGVAVAGSRTREGRTVLRTMEGLGRTGPAPVPVSARRFDAPTAALVTGTMGYSIGLTDTHAQSITHAGPSVIPAALSVGVQAGASGGQVLDAIVLGCEAVVRIGAVVNPSHRARGFHPTATCNVFGAAVAACHLLGSDERTTRWALGLAGSMSGGLYEFRNEGSMLMALHAGWPASSGIIAAYLAADGFTGPQTVLEGSEGFFRAFADVTSPELLLGSGSSGYGVEEISLRPYCACRYAHAGIDALQQIWAESGRVEPADVEHMIVYTHHTAVAQETEPNSVVGARLSTRFNLALALVRGPRMSEVEESDLVDAQVLAAAARVSVVEDPTLTAMFPAKWACRVELLLRDGRRLVRQVDVPKGEPENPLSADEISAKFHQLADPVLGPAGAGQLEGAIRGLPGAPDTGTIAAALTARGGQPAGEGTQV